MVRTTAVVLTFLSGPGRVLSDILGRGWLRRTTAVELPRPDEAGIP
jgi:hypothetical protein